MTPSSHTAATGYYRKALMAGCLCLALCVSDGAWGRSVGDTPGRGSQNGVQEGGIRDFAGSTAQGIASTEERFERFSDFIVRLKGDRGEDRILVCGVVVQLNRGMRLPEEKVQLRRIIYKTLKVLPGVPQIRKGIREKIKSRLNAFMGGGRVKNIYFTTFVLL